MGLVIIVWLLQRRRDAPGSLAALAAVKELGHRNSAFTLG
jgi:hypothetical protein